MATPKKPAPPQLASSRVARALDSVEFAKAVQNPEPDASGYPHTCQRFIDRPGLIRDPLWTDFLLKIIKQHDGDPLTCRYLIDHPRYIRDPAFTRIIVQIVEQLSPTIRGQIRVRRTLRLSSTSRCCSAGRSMRLSPK